MENLYKLKKNYYVDIFLVIIVFNLLFLIKTWIGIDWNNYYYKYYSGLIFTECK